MKDFPFFNSCKAAISIWPVSPAGALNLLCMKISVLLGSLTKEGHLQNNL